MVATQSSSPINLKQDAMKICLVVYHPLTLCRRLKITH